MSSSRQVTKPMMALASFLEPTQVLIRMKDVEHVEGIRSIVTGPLLSIAAPEEGECFEITFGVCQNIFRKRAELIH